MGAAPGMRQAADAIADGDAHTSTATGAMTSVPAASSSAVRSRRSSSLLGVVADRVVVALGDDLLQLAVHEGQRDADRAEAFALAAADAAAGEMQSSGDVPGEVATRMRRGLDPLGLTLVDDAALADAERADLTAGVAAHALVELLGPEGPAHLEGLGIERGDALVDGHARPWRLRLRLADEMIDERGLAVVAPEAARSHVFGRERVRRGQLGLLEDTAAAHADEHDVVAGELRFAQQARDRLGVATLDHDADPAEVDDVVAPRVQVGDEVVGAARVEDQLVGICRVGHEDRTGAAARVLPADDDAHRAVREQLAGEVVELAHAFSSLSAAASSASISSTTAGGSGARAR
jgi:hypothetical protein